MKQTESEEEYSVLAMYVGARRFVVMACSPKRELAVIVQAMALIVPLQTL